MQYDYNSIFQGLEGGMETFIIWAAVIYGVLLLWSLAVYIMRSLSLYSIAKRRGIANYGVAWVPVGFVWTLGSIADQYDAAHGIRRKWRHVLLWMTVAMAAVIIVYYIVVFAVSFSVGYQATQMPNQANDFQSYLGPIIALYAGMIPLIMLSTAITTCTYITYYKLFESCKPKRAVLFLLLSILVPFAFPFCLLSCRNRDLGMPEACVPDAVDAGKAPAAIAAADAEGILGDPDTARMINRQTTDKGNGNGV